MKSIEELETMLKNIVGVDKKLLEAVMLGNKAANAEVAHKGLLVITVLDLARARVIQSGGPRSLDK